MKQSLSRLWRAFERVTVPAGLPPAEANRVRATNLLAVWSTVGCAPYLVINQVMGSGFLALLAAVAMASFLVVVVLNALGHSLVGRVLYVVVNLAIVAAGAQSAGDAFSIDLFFAVIGALPLVLFERRHLVLIVALVALSVALSVVSSAGLVPGVPPTELEGLAHSWLRHTLAPFAVLTVALFFSVIYFENQRSERGLASLVGELQAEVTRRSGVERQLTATSLEASAASAAKSAFLANMSHEIRTPLAGVIGLTDVALLGAVDADTRDLLEQARGSAEHLLGVLNDVLDLSKIEAGRLDLEVTPLDVRQSVEEVVRLARVGAHTRGLELQLEYIDDARPWRLADPQRLKQILHNLLSNALKFTPEGLVKLTVEAVDAETVRFEVEDTGIGMSPEQIARLFSPFQQAEQSISRRFGGTGLGLAICQKLVASMGGELRCESAPGQGARFWFGARLPESGPPRPALPAPELDDPLVPRGLRVLVIDDSPVNALVARRMLARMGQEVEVAADAGEALRILDERRFDLLFMDLHMPGMDGYEATRELRRREGERGGRVPIVALTADQRADVRRACQAAGLDDILVKPLRRDALAALFVDLFGPRDPHGGGRATRRSEPPKPTA